MSHRSAISATRPSAVNQTNTSPVMKQNREHFMHHIRWGNDLTFWLNAHSWGRLSNFNVHSVSKITLCSAPAQRDKHRGFFFFCYSVSNWTKEKAVWRWGISQRVQIPGIYHKGRPILFSLYLCRCLPRLTLTLTKRSQPSTFLLG